MVLKGKKGFFFTLGAIFLLSLFLVSYTLYENSQERKDIQKRVTTMNSYLFSFEKDLSRKIYISGYRIIFLAEKKIVDSGDYIENISYFVDEAFFNGTVDSVPQEILLGFNFSSIKSELESRANKINTNLSLSYPYIEIDQVDPWNIRVTLTVNLSFSDSTNLATWNKTAHISSLIPISNFEDPLYYVEANKVGAHGTIINKITPSPYSSLVSGTDVSNLSSFAINSYYISSSSAPSFLDRLQGINSPNTYGIESIVNLQKLSQQEIPAQNKSVVDYIYFSDSDPDHYGVTGLPSWFRLDTDHLNTYNVSSLFY